MPRTRGFDVRRGVVPLVGYAVLSAAMDVYAGNQFATVSPASIAAVSFTLTLLFFGALEARRRDRPVPGVLPEHRGDLIAINVTTAVTWLATLYALDFLEPAIVNTLGLALGPVITVLAGPLLRPSSRVLAAEVMVSVVTCGLLAALVWVSFAGRSGLGDIAPRDATIGLAFTLACAAGSALNIIYMKRLSEAGCSPGTVLATRFFLISAAAWLLVAGGGQPDLGAALVPGAVVAVIGVGLPIYVLQIGIRHTEPITTSLVISLSPLFAFTLQLADARLRFSPLTFAGVVSVVVLVAAGAVVRQCHDARAEAVGAAVPQAAALPVCSPEPKDRKPMICAIVDAYGAGRMLPAALRARGVDVVHLRSQFPDTRLEYRPADFAVDLRYSGDLAATVAALRELGVTEVVAAAESGVLLADEVAAALEVPGNALDRSLARRDKFAMQQVVVAAGLAAIQGFRSASAGEMVAWVEQRDEWPVVLKPVLSAGTDNVHICETTDQAVAAHNRIMASEDRYGRSNDVVLAQEFLDGTEHYVNTVSRDGQHRVIEVWRYHKRMIDGRPVYDYEDLLALDEPGVPEIVDYARAVLDALGITDGAAHTEIMVTARGPVLLECGARLGGGQMPDLLDRCVGTDQVDSLAFSLADPKSFVAEAEYPYQLKSGLRCVNLISPAEGLVPAHRGWEPVRELGSFAAMVINHPPDTPLTRTVDMATCPGTVYLAANDLVALEEDYRTLRTLELNGLYTRGTQ